MQGFEGDGDEAEEEQGRDGVRGAGAFGRGKGGGGAEGVAHVGWSGEIRCGWLLLLWVVVRVSAEDDDKGEVLSGAGPNVGVF